MKLTQFTDYSLRTLIYLAVYSERLCTTKEIADNFNISTHHMVKVIHNLAKHGYIITQKGKRGGVRLSKPPQEIRLSKVVLKIEPDLNIVECFDPSASTCNINSVCQLKSALFAARNAFIKELSSYTLADITKNKSDLIKTFNK